ncbi:hypothetical protein LPJ64_002517 [Coemansia asiatica]|uniref:DUF3020 domain-containing protein n=1 Tax=Coemansia asiatica TaxID=1052880 RepID=A0A9W7XMM1_9FUNG|nr:hypothetical protein LPJ64_002517 [Coemansia asiatica]
MLSSARSFSKQVLSHRQQIQQQTKTQLRNQQQHGQHNGATRPKEQLHEDDAQHTSLMLEKMRQENRERKKRWREVNGERNKDNDLRCRVNKRANQLYGSQSSEAKARWIVEEFERRQQRRRDKGTRKRSPLLEEEDDGQAKAKCARKEGIEDAALAVRQSIPMGFGSYAAMPVHQIRAAQDFWKCAAGHHALETSTLSVGERPTLPSLAKIVVTGHEDMQSLSPTTKTSHRPPMLPPLSSVIPEECLSHFANNGAVQPAMANAAANVHASALQQQQQQQLSNPSVHVPPLSHTISNSSNCPLSPIAEHHYQQHHYQQRHVRPWEEDADDALCWSPAPGSVAYDRLLSPLQSSDSDLSGLSEAAFSLMSLSSSASTSASASACDRTASPPTYHAR